MIKGMFAEIVWKYHWVIVVGISLSLVSCNFGGKKDTRYSKEDLSIMAQKVDDQLIVDCLLPGDVRMLGDIIYVTPRVPTRTTIFNCRTDGGEFVLHAGRDDRLKVWREAAKKDPKAQTYMGEIYEKGIGVAPDYKKAVEWYRKAAEQGSSRAQNNLGFLYEKGLGVAKDSAKALLWYRRAARLNGSVKITSVQSPKADAELLALQQEIDRRTHQTDSLLEQLEQAEEKLDAAQSQIDGRLIEYQQESRLDRQKLKSLINDKVNYGVRETELTKNIERLENQLGAYKKQFSMVVDESSESSIQLQELQEKIDRKARETDALRQQLEQAVEKLNTNQTYVDRLTAQQRQTLNDHEKELQVLINDKAETKIRELDLIERIKKLEKGVGESPVQGMDTLDFGTYYALIIGNADYELLTPLDSPENDAKDLAKILVERYGFNTTLLLNATREQIIDALSNFRRSLSTSDNLLIYYAGHGQLDGIGYWQAIDAKETSEANWISTIEINNILEQMKALHVLVVVDSCFSGAIMRGNFDIKLMAKEKSAWRNKRVTLRSRTALTSGGLEPVVDKGRGKNSVFAKAFLSFLERNDQIVDARSLYEGIAPEVMERARAIIGKSAQTPEYGRLAAAADENGEFYFVPSAIQAMIQPHFLAGLSISANTGISNYE